MTFVTITKNGKTMKVEKGAVSIYAMRGWTLVKADTATTQNTASTTASFSGTVNHL